MQRPFAPFVGAALLALALAALAVGGAEKDSGELKLYLPAGWAQLPALLRVHIFYYLW